LRQLNAALLTPRRPAGAAQSLSLMVGDSQIGVEIVTGQFKVQESLARPVYR
jgi:hypothetical protein